MDLPGLVVADINLLAARYQMAFSLGFHIILASFGVAFPLITLLLHRRGLRHGDDVALKLAKRWAKVQGVLFAVGAVSGTILSFEMGMLWPGMMGPFGDVIGLPFTLEGVSFFLEAIFLAIYLYGWDRLPARIHYYTLFPIIAAGFAGSFFIVAVNAWMNAPAGFSITAAGDIVSVDPWAAMLNEAVAVQYLHMLLAAYMVTGFTIAGVYAAGMLKGRRDRLHRLGFVVPFVVASLATPLQIVVGDAAGSRLLEAQPSKLAAMELLQETTDRAPLTLGGFLVDGEVVGGIEIPGVASLLAGKRLSTVVPGLDAVPPDELPPVNIVHWSFQLMVALGSLLLLLAFWHAVVWWRRRDLPASVWFWRLASIGGVAAIAAMELGWVTTEVGRQPWIVYGIVRTSDAVTAAPGIVWVAAITTAVYLVLGTVTIGVLRLMSRRFARGEDVPAPYGPGVVM